MISQALDNAPLIHALSSIFKAWNTKISRFRLTSSRSEKAREHGKLRESDQKFTPLLTFFVLSRRVSSPSFLLAFSGAYIIHNFERGGGKRVEFSQFTFFFSSSARGHASLKRTLGHRWSVLLEMDIQFHNLFVRPPFIMALSLAVGLQSPLWRNWDLRYPQCFLRVLYSSLHALSSISFPHDPWCSLTIKIAFEIERARFESYLSLRVGFMGSTQTDRHEWADRRSAEHSKEGKRCLQMYR